MDRWQPVVEQPDRLGESPFWHPGEGRLYWVDIPGRQLRRAVPGAGPADSWPMPQEPGCIAPARDGGLVVALRDGIYRVRTWGGALERLQPAPYDPATSRYNDGKADPRGRFWAGTLFEPKHTPLAELHCLDPATGALTRVAGEATTGNGLAWSPDADTLYWADTQARMACAWVSAQYSVPASGDQARPLPVVASPATRVR
ncbi:MAG: SMP-30/gluconolactonase/LRE family protein, partial [Comamonadaceae bacterium]